MQSLQFIWENKQNRKARKTMRTNQGTALQEITTHNEASIITPAAGGHWPMSRQADQGDDQRWTVCRPWEAMWTPWRLGPAWPGSRWDSESRRAEHCYRRRNNRSHADTPGNFVLLLYLDAVTAKRIQSLLKLLLGYGTLPALHLFSTSR